MSNASQIWVSLVMLCLENTLLVHVAELQYFQMQMNCHQSLSSLKIGTENEKLTCYKIFSLIICYREEKVEEESLCFQLEMEDVC